MPIRIHDMADHVGMSAIGILTCIFTNHRPQPADDVAVIPLSGRQEPAVAREYHPAINS